MKSHQVLMIFWSIKGKPVFGSKMIMFGTPHAANIDVGSLVDHGVRSSLA